MICPKCKSKAIQKLSKHSMCCLDCDWDNLNPLFNTTLQRQGKTTQMLLDALERPEKTIGLVFFNRANANYNKNRFMNLARQRGLSPSPCNQNSVTIDGKQYFFFSRNDRYHLCQHVFFDHYVRERQYRSGTRFDSITHDEVQC